MRHGDAPASGQFPARRGLSAIRAKSGTHTSRTNPHAGPLLHLPQFFGRGLSWGHCYGGRASDGRGRTTARLCFINKINDSQVPSVQLSSGIDMKSLSPPDLLYLESAKGWCLL